MRNIVSGVGPSYSNETRSRNSTLEVFFRAEVPPADVPGIDRAGALATFEAATEGA